MLLTQSRIPPSWDFYHSEILTASGFSPVWDPPHSEGFSSEPKTPTAVHPWSPSIVMQLYHSHIITCNTLLVWTVMRSGRFSACNPNRLAPMIMTITTNQARAVAVVHQFCLHASIHVRYILSFFSKEKEVASLFLRAYTPHCTESFPVPVHHHTSSLSVLVHPIIH